MIMEEEKKKVKKPKSKARKIIEWVLTGVFGVLFIILGIGQIDGMVHQKDHFGQTLKFGYGTFVVQTDSMEKDVSGKKVYGIKSALITHLDNPDKIYKDYLSYKGTDKHIDVTFHDSYIANTEYSKPVEPENSELTVRTPSASYPIITHRVREIHVNPNVKKGEGKYTFIVAGINPYSTNLGWKEGEPPITINQYQVFTEKELLGRVVVGSAFLGGVFGFVSSIWGLLILLLIPAFYLVITSVIDIFKAYKEPEEEKASGGSSNGDSSGGSKGTVELSEEDKKRLKEELLQEMLDKKKGGN